MKHDEQVRDAGSDDVVLRLQNLGDTTQRVAIGFPNAHPGIGGGRADATAFLASAIRARSLSLHSPEAALRQRPVWPTGLGAPATVRSRSQPGTPAGGASVVDDENQNTDEEVSALACDPVWTVLTRAAMPGCVHLRCGGCWRWRCGKYLAPTASIHYCDAIIAQQQCGYSRAALLAPDVRVVADG